MSERWEVLVPADIRALGRKTVEIQGAETAWPLQCAEPLILWLSSKRYAVLGGDFYAQKDGRLEPTYENWHCNLRSGEAWNAYIDRSCNEAKRALEGAKPQYWFVIVASLKPTAEQKQEKR